MDGVCISLFTFPSLDLNSSNLGNNEEEYYTRNRMENSRCELFPGSPNGRLIIEARKVRSYIVFLSLNQLDIS